MQCFLNSNGQEVATFTFDNGYTLSLVKMWGESFCNTSAAYRKGDEFTRIGSELSDDEVAAAFHMVAKLDGLPPTKKART